MFYVDSSDTTAKSTEIGVRQPCFKVDTIAERASSRQRRTNDRSVRVISSDAEHATLMSYASKRKYKLDLSSLHEDHEDDENAEIGVPLHAPQTLMYLLVTI